MKNEKLIETTKDIVVAMISSGNLKPNSLSKANAVVVNAIEEVYAKLAEINAKDTKIGYDIRK